MNVLASAPITPQVTLDYWMYPSISLNEVRRLKRAIRSFNDVC